MKTINPVVKSLGPNIITVKQMAIILNITERSAYNIICNSNSQIRVKKIGRLIRIQRKSFENFLGEELVEISPLFYKVSELSEFLDVSKRSIYNLCNNTKEFKIVRFGRLLRIHKKTFDDWMNS